MIEVEGCNSTESAQLSLSLSVSLAWLLLSFSYTSLSTLAFAWPPISHMFCLCPFHYSTFVYYLPIFIFTIFTFLFLLGFAVPVKKKKRYFGIYLILKNTFHFVYEKYFSWKIFLKLYYFLFIYYNFKNNNINKFMYNIFKKYFLKNNLEF